VQNGIKEQVTDSLYSIEIKGDYSWGFAQKEKATISDCLDLKDVEFKVKKGEFVVLAGKVGSGKSNLINAICGNMIYLPKEVLAGDNG
jgi:ABC-type polysaccharide/polyol phosphate transport system ATPase subunit